MGTISLQWSFPTGSFSGSIRSLTRFRIQFWLRQLVEQTVCLELQKTNPDMKKISYWMQRYFYAVALQGAMQVVIIVIMTRFRAGV